MSFVYDTKHKPLIYADFLWFQPDGADAIFGGRWAFSTIDEGFRPFLQIPQGKPFTVYISFGGSEVQNPHQIRGDVYVDNKITKTIYWSVLGFGKQTEDGVTCLYILPEGEDIFQPDIRVEWSREERLLDEFIKKANLGLVRYELQQNGEKVSIRPSARQWREIAYKQCMGLK